MHVQVGAVIVISIDKVSTPTSAYTNLHKLIYVNKHICPNIHTKPLWTLAATHKGAWDMCMLHTYTYIYMYTYIHTYVPWMLVATHKGTSMGLAHVAYIHTCAFDSVYSNVHIPTKYMHMPAICIHMRH